MHFEALLILGILGAGFVASSVLSVFFTFAFAAAFAFTVDFLVDAGFTAALSEQCLFEHRLSIINEPHSQKSANGITPSLYTAIKLSYSA